MSSSMRRSTSFKPGKSGNPGGKPKNPQKIADHKVLADVKQLAREAGEDAIRALKDVMMSSKSPPAARVTAASALLDRGYGKPPAFVTGDADQFRDAIDMTDEQLLTIAASVASSVLNDEKPNHLN